MDMDLDDDDTQTTILKGSWKTTEDALTESSESSSQSDSKKRSPAPPSSIVSPVLMQINSAPASIATTPIRQDNADLLPTQIPQRHQWNGRRATALDFIPKTRQQTPFVQERVLSYLIDLDDEDGDEPGGDTFRETFTLERASAPRGRMTEPAKKSAESQSLLNIQRKMKELNDLIKIKELARQSSNSAKNTGLKKTHSSTMSQSAASSPIVNSPAMDSPVPSPGKLPQTADQSPKPAAEIKPDSAVNDDASQLRRSLGDDTVSLEQLRSLLQECEKETSAASSILENMASVKKDDKQVLDALQKAFAQAQETVNAKEQELAEAKLQLEEIRARVESTTTRLTDTDRTRDKLQKRIQQGQEKSTRLKSSIGLLQQDIIRKRTRLMIIESGSAAAGDMVPIGNTQAQAKPESVGSKRDVNTQDGHSSHVAPKKPRIQAREEMNALAKRMQELSRERALLQSGVLTPVPPTATTSGSTSRPSSASSNSNPAILSSLASSKHARTPSQQGPLKPPTPAPAINSTPARAGHKPSATPADLSRLDEFLSQTKNLPINRMVDRAAPTSLSSWRVAPSIKKLFWEAGCLFDLDQLCLPSELIQYAIPNHQTETPAAPSSTQTKSDGTPAGTGASLDYKSLLPMFRSYRFSPRYRDTVRDGYRSLTYSHKIDPSKPICIYELSGGSCNDDSCKSQHLRDCIPTDEELIIDMARYSEGNTPEARRAFAEMQSARLAHLRAAGIHHADLLVDSIVRNHQEFVRDSSRVVKFENRIALDNSQAEDRTVRDERKTSGRNRAVDHAMFASKSEPDPFDHNAIVMSIIAKASEGTPNKNRRYHEHRTSEYYQKQLGIDPSNEALWIQYAVFLLTEVDVEDSHVGKAMHALASGLSANPRSESLWSAYLDLCVRNGAEVETREMFEECLLYIPDAQLVWFRYYIWEKERDKRVYVLDRMLERACQHPREGDDTSTRSRFALDVVLQIVKMMVSEDFVESAKNWLQNFLTCASWDSIVPSSLSYAQMDDVWVDQDMVDNVAGTFAAKVLTPTDHCVLWLAYVYLIWFHELPEQLFLDHPNNYLSDNRLFAIQWPRTDEPDQESELFNIVHEIFLGLTSYFVDSEARPPLVAIVKNFVEFLMARGQQQSEILELVSPSQFPELLPEIGDLFCQVQMRFNQYEEARRDLEQVIQESPTQPYLWNRYARLLPVEGKIACLEQCVIEFFILKPSDETSTHRSELALLLYKKLLGLGLPYSYVAPTPRLDIAPFKTNTFLWMNYLSLLALHSRRDNSFIQLETGFSVAQELVPMDKSFAVQTEFAVHSIMKELDKYQNGALHSTIVSAVGGISVTKANPYDHSTMEDTNALSLRDFSRLNRVVESIWNQTAEGPQELRVEIMDVFLRLYPENPELYFWMGEAEELAGHAKQCRKIAVACLKRFPLSESVWKRMMQMLTGSMSQESMEVIMKASLLSPLAARMSKMPLLQAAEKRIKGFQPNKAEPPPPQQQQQQDAGVTEGHMSDIQDQESDSDVDMVN
ncbi:Zinc finger C3H1 domain-containing protein [Mortierella sp. GBA43]|nr:Zinc finger C3H1 domain-containing protein [Mortierella sp. GBA43]